MKDFEAGRHRLALNRLFRKIEPTKLVGVTSEGMILAAGVNKYTECRVCNFKGRSIIVVNAACNDETSYEISAVILDYTIRHKDVRMLIGNYIYPEDASPEKSAIESRLWVLV